MQGFWDPKVKTLPASRATQNNCYRPIEEQELFILCRTRPLEQPFFPQKSSHQYLAIKIDQNICTTRPMGWWPGLSCSRCAACCQHQGGGMNFCLTNLFCVWLLVLPKRLFTVCLDDVLVPLLWVTILKGLRLIKPHMAAPKLLNFLCLRTVPMVKNGGTCSVQEFFEENTTNNVVHAMLRSICILSHFSWDQSVIAVFWG